MIYKLQKPLSTNGEAEVLAYTEGRQNIIQVPLTDTLNILFGPKLKIYAEAEAKGAGLVVYRVVPDRRW